MTRTRKLIAGIATAIALTGTAVIPASPVAAAGCTVSKGAGFASAYDSTRYHRVITIDANGVWDQGPRVGPGKTSIDYAGYANITTAWCSIG